MKIITRTIAIKNLKKYIDKILRKLALEHGITTPTRQESKTRAGRTLFWSVRRDMKTNISKAPNGLTYELKSLLSAQ